MSSTSAVAALRSNVLPVIVTVVLVSAATPPPVDCPLPRDVDRRNERQRHRSRPACHVRVEFGEEVGGPIVLGNMRYLGLGLCIPMTVPS